MSNSSSYIPGGTIESATAFFGSAPRAPAPRPTSQQTRAFSDKHQSAMAKRLEQLQAALGDNAIVRSESAPLPASQDATQATKPTPSGHVFGTGTLLVTGLLAALLGAGALWLTNSHQAPPATLPEAGYQNPASVPQPVPVVQDTIPPEAKDEQNIRELVEAWRKAWQSRDIAGYLNAYSTTFTPLDGMSRETWRAARQKKLASGASIDIRISDLRIERLDPRQFKASFLQDYTAGNYRETARRKNLLIALDGEQWKIAREWQE